jgi:hypothetical protein
MLKVAYVIKEGISDFKFKQCEHAQVKVERARWVVRKLYMRNNSDSLKMIFSKGSGGGKGWAFGSYFAGKWACAKELLFPEKGCAPRTCCFGKKGVRQGLVVSGKRACATDLLFREKGHAPGTCCFGKKGIRQGLSVSGKRACARNLLFREKGRAPGTCCFGKKGNDSTKTETR